jgi:hypothetical protein
VIQIPSGSPTPLAELIIGAPAWTIPTIMIGTLLTFLVLWNYSKSPVRGTPAVWMGVALKLLAIALLAACLLQPMRRATRPRPRANLLPILVDTSGSMDLTVGRSETSWRDRIESTFATDSPVYGTLAQAFETRFYGFDKRLSSASEVSGLKRGASGSLLIENLSELAERLSGRPVAGVLLMSDGNVPRLAERLDSLPDFPFPIYPVVPSQVSGGNDLRITSTSVRQTNFEISPVTISFQFDVTGAMAGDAVAVLTDLADDRVIAEKTVSIEDAKTNRTVSFQFRPTDVGLRFYRVDLFRPADREAMSNGENLIEATSSETTLVNNTRFVAVDRRSGPYRVLYVSGRPNWEFKFLRRSVVEDAEVELTGLIRMANKEPKFSFRDRGVSGTNPLFQGLGEDTEETAEQYDEPVMIRIGVKQAEELAAGFPKLEEDLFKFDALILDDLEPEFFTPDQLAMIRRFVSSRGGGLMLLGGQEMFAGRDFGQSPLGELAPIYVRRGEQPPAGKYSLGLTREGLLQPWLRLRENASLETKRLRSMPGFTSINGFGGLKPGAYQLATAKSDAGETLPAIAVQRFGKGKVGAIAIADLWRWFMRPDAANPDDPAQAWRQITRWLVSDVPARATLSLAPSSSDEDQMSVRVDVVDDHFEPLSNAEVRMFIGQPNEQPLELKGQPIGEAPGAFQVSYYGETPGAYRVTTEVRSADGELIGLPETGWTRQIAGREFDRIGFNRELLESIADKSGGGLVNEDRLDSFQDRLDSGKVPVTETWVYPLWHRGWVIALALGCLCAEWGLRRWRGLA